MVDVCAILLCGLTREGMCFLSAQRHAGDQPLRENIKQGRRLGSLASGGTGGRRSSSGQSLATRLWPRRGFVRSAVPIRLRGLHLRHTLERHRQRPSLVEGDPCGPAGLVRPRGRTAAAAPFACASAGAAAVVVATTTTIATVRTTNSRGTTGRRTGGRH